MISFAAFVPHPPLLIPEIGKEDFEKVSATAKAMDELAGRIDQSDIDTIVIISPHGSLNPYEMTIGSSKKYEGDFSNFDEPEIKFSFKGDPELSDTIIEFAEKDEIPVAPQTHESGIYELDHGALVPLYYLTKETGPRVKIATVGYSMLPRAIHFSFGQSIGQAMSKSSERIAIIASGDLSHRHINNPAGSTDTPKKFDDLVKENLANFNLEKILLIDEMLQESAGECGYRSLLILLGAIDGIKVNPEVLSYEHPFGVGYLTSDFRVEE